MIIRLTLSFSIFFIRMFLFFHVEDNGILVEYAYLFLDQFLTLPNFDFITTLSKLSLI